MTTRNAGELAEGWYDPRTLRKAQGEMGWGERTRSASGVNQDGDADEEEEEEEEEGEEFGPDLPRPGSGPGHSSGPTIPSIQDLQLRKGISLSGSNFYLY